VRAVRKEDVLGALDQIASKLTARAGESLTTAKKYDTPIFEATTPSMEALRVYTLGQKKAYGGDTAAALLFFLRAVELDPNFPLAYTSLSLVYSIRRSRSGPPRLAARRTSCVIGYPNWSARSSR
jgi:eukaryotic-like serine/threonine-protein kinase